MTYRFAPFLGALLLAAAATAQDPGAPEKPAAPLTFEIAASGTGAISIKGRSTLPEGVVVYLRPRYGPASAPHPERDFATVKAIVTDGGRLAPVIDPTAELKIGPFAGKILLPGPYTVEALYLLDRQLPEVREKCEATALGKTPRLETTVTGLVGTTAELERHLADRKKHYEGALQAAQEQLAALIDAFGEVSWSFFAPKKESERNAAVRAWVTWIRQNYPGLLSGQVDADVERVETWLKRHKYLVADGTFRPEPWRKFLDDQFRRVLHDKRKAHHEMIDSVVTPSDSRSAADLEVALAVLEGFATTLSKRAYVLNNLPIDAKDDDVASPDLAGAAADEPIDRVRRLDKAIRERLGLAKAR